jgi:hypothetical protein
LIRLHTGRARRTSQLTREDRLEIGHSREALLS